MTRLIQGYKNVVTLTANGLKKRFVNPVSIIPYGTYFPDGTPLNERTDIALIPDPEKFKNELEGHSHLDPYFPLPKIIKTDEDECSITYEPFPNRDLEHIRADDLTRKIISNHKENESYKIDEDQDGIVLIEVNKDLGKRLRKMHEDTYDISKHKVKGTLDLHDRNILINNTKDRTLNLDELYRVIDFESFGEINIYDSLSNIPISEMITAAAIYENERKKDSKFNPAHLDIITPALRAYFDRYIGEKLPLWLEKNKIDEYDKKTSGVYYKLWGSLSQMPKREPYKDIQILGLLLELLEEKYVFIPEPRK